jgi:hypothetical protein
VSADPIRFELMAADRLPDDPQALIVDLLKVLRETSDDALALRKSVTTGVPSSRMTARSVEVFEGVARALDIAEALAPACRRRGVFAVEWGE